MSASRFDPYDADIRGCFCELCMALAGAHVRGVRAMEGASETLYKALVAGTHRKRGPKVSLTKNRCYRPVEDARYWMQVGAGIGIGTPGQFQERHERFVRRNRRG